MNLSPQLSHLPENKIKELEDITSRILETGMPVMILLFGSYARGDWTETQGIRSGKKSDYDLAILTKDERDSLDLKSKLAKMFNDTATVVQTVTETLGFVNMQLREKQYFYSEIKKQGIMLYSDKGIRLADEEDLSPTRKREIAERDFKNWFGMARVNLRNAEMNIAEESLTDNKKYFQKAAFELQQCVEHCYTTIEIVYSRNNPNEHRLRILRMNAARYAVEIEVCFPQDTEENSFLFIHLDEAYIAGRYFSEEQYKVTEAQLAYWAKETRSLLRITEEACKRKIRKLRELENN